MREIQDRHVKRQRDNEAGFGSVCVREKMLNGKRSETDGWVLERGGLR